MKKFVLGLIVSLVALPAFSMPIQQCVSFLSNANHCSRYEGNADAMKAMNIIAKNLQYSMEEMCNHERILDIFVDRKNLTRAENEYKIEPHIWVTLHYNEYSCQYFISEELWVVTKKNCYNTW